MQFFLVRVLLGVVATIGPLAVSAAEPAEMGERTPPPAPIEAAKPLSPGAGAAPVAPVLKLPTIQVTAGRIRELDREIKRLDKAISREKKRMKASDLDKVLNNQKLTDAAALLGGNSAAHMEAVAATRVNYMETERSLLSDMRQPRSLEDLKMLQTELEKVREMQRDLDRASR